ncbi:hypothetical protein GCM10009627_19200 [Curtobacterium herbarum]|uniref:Uncharacterized protein n=1 Tax=Curtobacterium herbarum TaxID=150122 RepID=A0ABP4K8A5_9MICO
MTARREADGTSRRRTERVGRDPGLPAAPCAPAERSRHPAPLSAERSPIVGPDTPERRIVTAQHEADGESRRRAERVGRDPGLPAAPCAPRERPRHPAPPPPSGHRSSVWTRQNDDW